MKKKQRKAPAGTISGKALDTTWRTPQHVLRIIASYYRGGQILFDVANTEDNWTQAKEFWTEKDDALGQKWPRRVYCNPPYGGDLKRWCKKMEEEAHRGVEIVTLLGASRFEQLYFQNMFKHVNALCFPRKRIHFLRMVRDSLPCRDCGSRFVIPVAEISAGPVPCPDCDSGQLGRSDGRPLRFRGQAYLSEGKANNYASMILGFNVDLERWEGSFPALGICSYVNHLGGPVASLEKRGFVPVPLGSLPKNELYDSLVIECP